jgi:hypothetical protein
MLKPSVRATVGQILISGASQAMHATVGKAGKAGKAGNLY